MPRNPLKTLVLLLGAALSAGAAEPTYKRTLEPYSMPEVVLVNQDGAKVPFKPFMEADKPVVVQFIFGTCTTFCPVLSMAYVNLQQKLGAHTQDVRLVSITIDPENDTPKVLKDYLQRYRAQPGWDCLTGSREDIDAVMRAFNAYTLNKMYHYPLTFIRSPKDGQWLRLLGLMSASEFVAEYEKVGIH